jgi:hypothetical protein
MPRTKSLLSRDSLRTLDPEVYERAAERIKDQNDYSCVAISASTRGWEGLHGRHGLAYAAAFAPAFDEEPIHPFWNKTPDINGRGVKRIQNERYTALLMMAAMVRSAKASRGVKKPKAESDGSHFQDRAALIGPGSWIGLDF